MDFIIRIELRLLVNEQGLDDTISRSAGPGGREAARCGTLELILFPITLAANDIGLNSSSASRRLNILARGISSFTRRKQRNNDPTWRTN